MKGKSKKKRKIGKVILIGMGFFLTVVLTFTTTLAWFYDSDWASKYVQMGGTVGIVIKDSSGNVTHGSGNLHFTIQSDLAYPGQAVDVSASCYNDGGRSSATGGTGSACYVRARFAVYTNVGKAPDPEDYKTSDYPLGTDNPDYTKDLSEATQNQDLSAESLYRFLDGLITKQNNEQNLLENGYNWVYYQKTGALPLSDSGTGTTDKTYYLDGTTYTYDEASASWKYGDVSITATNNTIKDRGYFYLCKKNSTELFPLTVNSSATYLWNNTFVIPWTLTNLSADKYIYVGVVFQAVQTYIPIITDGVIDGTFNNTTGNQLAASDCTYDAIAVQTVFNTCDFSDIPLVVEINGDPVNFGDSTKYNSFTDKNALSSS